MTARTAALIRMRALGDPDVAPDGERDHAAWRPWRSYAVSHLRANAANAASAATDANVPSATSAATDASATAA